MRRNKAFVFFMSLLVTATLFSGCKSDKGASDTNETTTVNEGTTVSESDVVVDNEPVVYLEDYNLRVLQGSDLDFMVIPKNVATVNLTEDNIVMPEGVSGEPMVIETDNGDYEIIIFGLVGNAGRYEMTIQGSCFVGDTGAVAEDLLIPFSIDNGNISEDVRLTCTPASCIVEKGGTLTCLLEYTGDIAQYNLGAISVTCHGFTADADVTLSKVSDEHMLVLSNIMPEADATETYFDLCEGTVYDSKNKPCNEYIVDIEIVDSLPED